MAKELEGAAAVSGGTAYFILRANATGFPWDTTLPGLAASWVDANYAHYAIPTTEQGTSAVYFGDLPASLPAGNYNAIMRMQAGGAPVLGGIDAGFATFDFYWNGTAIVTFSDVSSALATLQTTAAEVAVDTDAIITAQGSQATSTALATMQTAVTEIAVDTDAIITGQGSQATSTALAAVQTAATEIAVDTDTLLTGQAAQATATAQAAMQTAVTEIAVDTDAIIVNQASQATSTGLVSLAASMVTALSDLASIMTSLATDLGDQTTLATAIGQVKAVTDQFRFVGNNVEAAIQGAVQLDPDQSWTSGGVTRGTTKEILRVLRAWARGRSDASEDLLTRNFYDYSDTDVLFQNIYDNTDNPTVRNTAGT